MSTAPNSRTFAFVLITFLFFLWGAITSINDVLISVYTELHDLTDLQSMYILLAFFGAYGFGALAYYLYSRTYGDPINRLGYKTGMLSGIAISGTGCFSLSFLMNSGSYETCLISFVIIGLGLTLLQISCNPYVAILGPSNTASSRLNLSQGFNSLGTTVGPLIAGGLVSSYISSEVAVQDLYLLCGGIFIAFGIFLYFVKLPDYASDEPEATQGSVFQFRHLIFGMIAIFFYVGAEVMIGGKIMEYVELENIGNLSREESSSYLGIYWGGAMIGRLAISVISSDKFNLLKKVIFGFLTITGTYLLILFFITLKSKIIALDLPFNWDTFSTGFSMAWYEFSPILPFITVQFVLMLVFRKSSARLLSIFSILIIAALISAYFAKGELALWFVLSIGLFNSVMWSNIFTLSISGLGDFTSKGSSLLVIMIVGGAVLPLLMGYAIDWSGSLEAGFLFPIISYLYILYFGLFESKNNKQLSEQL